MKIIFMNGAYVEVEYIRVDSLKLSTRHVFNLNNRVYETDMGKNLIFVFVLDSYVYYFHFNNEIVTLYYDCIVDVFEILCDI